MFIYLTPSPSVRSQEALTKCLNSELVGYIIFPFPKRNNIVINECVQFHQYMFIGWCFRLKDVWTDEERGGGLTHRQSYSDIPM